MLLCIAGHLAQKGQQPGREILCRDVPDDKSFIRPLNEIFGMLLDEVFFCIFTAFKLHGSFTIGRLQVGVVILNALFVLPAFNGFLIVFNPDAVLVFADRHVRKSLPVKFCNDALV